MPQWDENKRLANLEKHGVDFRVVAEMFTRNEYVYYQEVKNSLRYYGEERNRFIGEVDGVFYSGVMTFRDGDQRLITARRAGTKDKNKYLQNK